MHDAAPTLFGPGNSRTAGRPGTRLTANSALKFAARFWFAVAVTGQWIFVSYIALFYGGLAFQGRIQEWNTVLPHGYEPGNTVGNVFLGAHLLLAIIITVGGPLQFVRRLRSYAPVFHRWNGRVYLLTVFAISIDGLYLGLSGRKVVGGVFQQIPLVISAFLIMIFAVLAFRYALARDFGTHRRWALRLFMVVNGVWFFRVGLMFWILINGAPVGFDPETFTGPFLNILAVSVYFLPLVILEIYFHARDEYEKAGQFAVAIGLSVLTVAMGIGIFGAAAGMWLPRAGLVFS